MNTQIHHTKKLLAVKALAVAAAAFYPNPSPTHAAPTGGVVVGGSGTINQTGNETRINQGTQYLSLQWDTFNVGVDERVEFVQYDSRAVALNWILDNNGSQILGRIDADGHVILVNPNGILFGRNATIDVGGLVASGLDIDSADFMNGDLVFSAVEGSAGAVINRGLINAASGGNVALLGKSVANHGLISAEFGHVALAAGSEVVITFDDSGLIGVRIDSETLASEVDGNFAVNNTGTLEARGGKILLNASVSADLFSEAVNHGGLNGTTEAIVHDDGSFSLGAGNAVRNAGVLDVSSETGDAGYVVAAGAEVAQRGSVFANAEDEHLAGQVYVAASERINLGAASRMQAKADGISGKLSLSADRLTSAVDAHIETTGHTFIDGDVNLRTPRLKTQHLRLASAGTVRQAGAAVVTGNTHLVGGVGADLRLSQGDNDLQSLSVRAEHEAVVVLNESNDLALGDLELSDASVRITSRNTEGTVTQLPGSTISVDGSALHITADNLFLGESGATTDVFMGDLRLIFARRIATNGSITLHDDGTGIYANSGLIESRDTEWTDARIELRGDRLLDLNAISAIVNPTFEIESMKGRNARLTGISEKFTQSGPINLAGTLAWDGWSAELTHPENDIAAIEGTGGFSGEGIRYVDRNNLVIRNLSTSPGGDGRVHLTSVGEGGVIRQAPNTRIAVDFLSLTADNIILGANGSSSMYLGVGPEFNFSNQMTINGPTELGVYSPYGPMMFINGDDGDNRLEIGEHATFDGFSQTTSLSQLIIDLGGGNDTAVFNSEFLINPYITTPGNESGSIIELNMGAGDDRVFFNRSVTIPLILGEGNDRVRIWDMGTHYHLLDFDRSEDRFLVANP